MGVGLVSAHFRNFSAAPRPLIWYCLFTSDSFSWQKITQSLSRLWVSRSLSTKFRTSSTQGAKAGAGPGLQSTAIRQPIRRAGDDTLVRNSPLHCILTVGV